MLHLDEKPDAKTIRQLTTHFERVWRRTHTWNSVRDEFYNRTFALWPKGSTRPVFRPGKARSIIDHAVDQLLGSDPTIERFGDDKAEANDQVEKALRSIFHQVALQSTSPAITDIKKHLLLYGYTVWEDDLDSADLELAQSKKPERETNEDPDDFKQRERTWGHKQRAAMPFRVLAPHPNDVLLDPGQKVPKVAIKRSIRLSQDLVDLTIKLQKRNRGDVTLFAPRNNPFEEVATLEYWTPHWHAMMLDNKSSSGFFGSVIQALGGGVGQLLFVMPNDWGFVPFSHAFSGRGNRHAGVRFDPVMLAVGLLDHIMDDLRAHAQDLAAKHNLLLEAGFMPAAVVDEDPAEMEEQLAASGIVKVRKKGNFHYIERPQLPRQMNELDHQLEKDIEESTFTRSISGIRDVGVTTVGQQAILNTAAQRGFIVMGNQVNQLATTSASHMMMWVDMLDLKLNIEGNEINRKNIDGDFTAKVTFQVVDPVLRLQEKQMGLAELKERVIALPDYWALAGISDASGMRERLAEDLVYAHPLVQEEAAKIAAERIGLGKLLAGQNITGGGVQDNTQKKILGPDGEPISSTMGTGGPRLRQPLDGNTTKPGQTGQNLAG